MALTVKDVRDLTRLLGAHPEWLAEVRRLVLTDELLTLPGLVRELAEAQTRTEARLESLTARVEELAQAQKRTEQRIEELAQAQERTEQQLTELTAAQRRTEQALFTLADAHTRTVNIVSQLLGRDLERKYRERAGVYFGRWLKQIQVLSPNELRDVLEARLSEDEVDEIMLTDVLIRGQLRQIEGSPEVWLLLEVSHVIDRYDVDRAQKRAGLLRRAGYRAIPVVAGERMLDESESGVLPGEVAVFLDGSHKYWERAVQAALRAE